MAIYFNYGWGWVGSAAARALFPALAVGVDQFGDDFFSNSSLA